MLLDELVFVVCMVYVDLNLVWVKMVKIFEVLDYISIKYCINVVRLGKIFKRFMFFVGNLR